MKDIKKYENKVFFPSNHEKEKELWVKFACAAIAGGSSIIEVTPENCGEWAIECADHMIEAYKKRF